MTYWEREMLQRSPSANAVVLACVRKQLFKRAVDDAISDISPFLTDDEVLELANALYELVDR